MFDSNDDSREELHFRRIDMRGWRRKDGLYEIEGRVTDRKPHACTSTKNTKTVPANEPIHEMGVRLVFDTNMMVHDVFVVVASAPYQDCLAGGQALQKLKGLRMASGWSKEVKRLLGGAQSCTHVMELLIPMATAAFQSLTMVRQQLPDTFDANGKPNKVDSCYAYGADRGVVMRRWPNFYTGLKVDAAKDRTPCLRRTLPQ